MTTIAKHKEDLGNIGMTTDSKTWRGWFNLNRTRLVKNGIYLDGGEPGRMDPAEFERASLRILLCRLSTYDDVLHSITHKMLYWAARQTPGVYADLAFFPPDRDFNFLRKGGVPVWLASGSKVSPAAFDVVAISVSVQQEALNLPAALAFSGLKVSFGERMADAAHPLVVLGGNAAASVPFIHGNVAAEGDDGGLVDAVCVGDGVGWIQEFVRLVADSKRKGESKPALLAKLAREVAGTYVPSLYKHAICKGNLVIESKEEGIPFPVKHRVEPAANWTAAYDGAFIPFCEEDIEETLPLTYGCAHKCRFCQTGWIRGAHQQVAASGLVECALRVKSAMAASDLNLLSSDACGAVGVEQAIKSMLDIFPRVSVKSLTVAGLSKRPEMIEMFRRMDKREFTFGVEGISARLRARIGKRADSAALVRLVEALASSGLRQLKLFFIATGLEGAGDIAEFDSLLRRIRSAAPRCRLITSFTPLFNAPFTPLQFERMRGIDKESMEEARRVVEQAGGEFRWSSTPEEIRLMNLFCRAGRLATPTLVNTSLAGDARYYGAAALRVVGEAEASLRRAIPDCARLEREFELADTLPWDDIEAGASKKSLWAAFGASKKEESFESPREARTVAIARPRGGETSAGAKEGATFAFWAWLPAEDAWRPGATLARALLRDLFREWREGAKLCFGHQELFRFKGASGLSLLKARFSASAEPPQTRLEQAYALAETRRAIIEGPVDAGKLDPRQFIYLLEFASSAAQSVDALLEDALRKRGVPFQLVRKGAEIWRFVGASHWKRHGIMATRSLPGISMTLLCSEEIVETLGSARARGLGGGVAKGVYARGKCPDCGAPTPAAVKLTDDTRMPRCLACFLRGRGKA